MKTCPQCHHRPSKEELKFFPEYCCKCGTLYSALEVINEKKRKENENLNAWRITRWRPSYKNGFLLGVPVAMAVMFVVYYVGQIVITNSRPISNEIYRLTKEDEENTINLNTTIKSFESKKTHPEEDVLIVSTKEKTTVWFVDQNTNNKYGPYIINGNKTEKISLKRGTYIAKIIKDGKTTLLTVNFWKNDEKLDL